jgi:imidazoleglycerol-phosphate dehydratase / histidinol-phosphatase
MTQKKILFIDRDGTLIAEPPDEQVDSIEKLEFLPGVMTSLLELKAAGYYFVMVSNQDGLGTKSLPTESFRIPHELMLRIFASQDIIFESIRICPHKHEESCECRKPKVGLLLDYLVEQKINRNDSWVIGDRETDLQLAKNLGIHGIRLGQDGVQNWQDIVQRIITKPRAAVVSRNTNETQISVEVNLDNAERISIATGIGFFDHMLEQLAKHGNFSLIIKVSGDLHIDDHHTVEDVALAIGEALRQALGDKLGIGRYGFLLPMDESLAQVALDLSGRPFFEFKGLFSREQVGNLSTELVPHFFQSLADSLKANLHIEVKGSNTHHMIEATFKAVGRALRQALAKTDKNLPSTKGVL